MWEIDSRIRFDVHLKSAMSKNRTPSSQIALVTGGSKGIGVAFVEELMIKACL